MLILIPAYEPDLRLVQLIGSLRAQAPEASVLVVDDGSGPAYDGVFDLARHGGAEVLRFGENRGKGVALKSGFSWAAEHRPGEAVVCADCDGQHSPTDILRVADAVSPGTMVLGGRRFTGPVPARSRFGNAVSRRLFRLTTGLSLHDTQTGLRGYPPDLLEWLQRVPGDRFEYEANLLFEAKAAGVGVTEIEIETIYLDANSSSHFRPIRDSARIYAPLLAFVGSSLLAAAVDWAGVIALNAALGNLPVAIVVSRVCSAWVNFRVNREVVFGDRGDERTALKRYAALAAGVLAANCALLTLLVDGLGFALIPSRLAVETALFVAGYVVQRRSVFRTPASVAGAPARGAGPAMVGPAGVPGPEPVGAQRQGPSRRTG